MDEKGKDGCMGRWINRWLRGRVFGWMERRFLASRMDDQWMMDRSLGR